MSLKLEGKPMRNLSKTVNGGKPCSALAAWVRLVGLREELALALGQISKT
jgi:hypothetical protein